MKQPPVPDVTSETWALNGMSMVRIGEHGFTGGAQKLKISLGVLMRVEVDIVLV